MVAHSCTRFTGLLMSLMVFVLAGCGGATVAPPSPSTVIPAAAPTNAAPTVMTAKANLAPDFAIPSPEQWYNSPPLTLAALRGTPVLLVFWSDI